MNKEEQQYEVLLANVREVFKSRQGKEVLWEILGYCNLYSPSAGKFEAGKRAVGIDILALLEGADKTIYPKLLLSMQND